MTTLIQILVALLLSAFFSGMEIAFISSNKLRFELEKKQKNITSAILTIFYNKPQQFISTMLVGNNIALVVYGMLMAKIMNPWLSFMNSQLLITLTQTILATLIVLVTGEFMPKTIFRINPNLWLRVFSWILFLFYGILYPLSYFSTWISQLILGMFRVNLNKTGNKNKVFSRIDLNYLIQETIEGTVNEMELEQEVKYFQNALDFSKVKLRDCSVPRTEIIALDENVDLESLKQTFIETGFSKIPIYKGNIDNIIGYIHSSEMFEHQHEWKKHIKQMPIVPENMMAHKLMKTFLQQKRNMAVVVDEFGGTDGIVTLEDIMEMIFGKIEDEHDNIAYTAQRISDKEFLFSGRLEVRTANEKFDLDLPESDDYDTIAGFILHFHQHFPKINEVIHIEGYTLKCVRATNNRIELVRLILGS